MRAILNIIIYKTSLLNVVMAVQQEIRLGSVERFGYEWSKYSNIIPDYEKQFLQWAAPLEPKDFKEKSVLDAGCGIGRNSFWPLNYGAKKVVAFDYDMRTVEVAKKNLEAFPNAKVGYESIYDISYDNEFDIVFSIGVIHHLADPGKAIAHLVRAAKRGGKVLIWVYGYEGNEWIVRYVNPARKLTSRLPSGLVHYLTYFCSVPLFSYVRLMKPRNAYLQHLRSFRFWHVHSIAFDQLIPKTAHYWKKEEALALFQEQGLKDVKISSVNGNSWTVVGTKK